MQGTIFHLQKFCVNDGPGIRTTVFLKGCPLNCLWCHNPESKSTEVEILFDGAKCMGCGQCAAVCPSGCHALTDRGHRYHRDGCTRCTACTEGCYAGALEAAGRTVSVEAVLDEVCKDEAFYRNSGGGLTLSGGEPMAQFDFSYALLSAAKARGLHTCMETCGFAPPAHYRRIAPLVDLFLFDYKLTDSAAHRRYTGVPNEPILENLRLLDRLGAAIILRCPIIPTINDTPDHFSGIAGTANALRHVAEIQIEPYHPLGSGKSALLGKPYPLEHLTFPESSTVTCWIEAVQSQTPVPVRQA